MVSSPPPPLSPAFCNHPFRRAVRQRGLLLVAVTAAFFPWVSFNLNELDTQPWFLLLAALYLLLTANHLQRRYGTVWLFMFGVGGLLAILHQGDAIQTIRGVATYISAGFAVLVFARYMQVGIETRRRMLVVVNICWLLYPLLQFAGMDEIAPLVVARTTENRGFTSLAPEPTFYGIFSLSMIAVLMLEREQWRLHLGRPTRTFGILIWLNVFQIILVAQSSMAILLLFLISMVGAVLYRPKAAAGVLLAILLSGYLLLGVLDPDVLSETASRPLQLAGMLLDEPKLILVLDQSINERFSAVYISIAESVGDFLLPHGLFAFETVSEKYARASPIVNSAQGNKIMSFVGSFLYELGAVSLLYFYVVGRALSNLPGFRGKVFWAVALGCTLLTAVPVGFPMVGYVIALLEAKRSPRRRRQRVEVAVQPLTPTIC
jgi:hypothetical protein